MIPTQNYFLYRKFIKINKKFACMSDYQAVYENDYEKFQNECEVGIGEYADMMSARKKIEKNYKKSKKIIILELLFSIIAVAVFVLI